VTSQPPDSAVHLTVVIMAYNEAANLAKVVHEIHDELCRLGGTFDILIADDGSSDGTGPLADELGRTLPAVRVCHHGTNQGLGGVYRTGFAEARGEWLTFYPADGQFPASLLGRYLAARSDVDMLLGILPERTDSLVGKALSRAERLLLSALFGHFPRFQGILMFRRSLLGGIPLLSQGRGWTVLMELILRAERSGARIRNVPITIRPRASGTSKVNNLRSVLSNLRQMISLRLHL
jgi:glycosyltransferase involved in cell wall biosynthesis